MKRRLVLLLSAFYFLLSSVPTQAARLYFQPQEQVAGSAGEFYISILLDAEQPLNALQVAVIVPPQFEPRDVREANSIISLWVDAPNFDPTTRQLTFSGIVPGGFSGREALLLAVNFKVSGDGTATLGFDASRTLAYLNGPDGRLDQLALAPLAIPIVPGKENIPVELPDRDPPEEFTPYVSRAPTLFGNRWFVAFATQDKGSGIARYEVAETWRRYDLDVAAGRRIWQAAESPYQLHDQSLRSYVYVKAVDKAGNVRIVTVEPRYPYRWYEYSFGWGILIALLLLSLVSIKSIKNKIKRWFQRVP